MLSHPAVNGGNEQITDRSSETKTNTSRHSEIKYEKKKKYFNKLRKIISELGDIEQNKLQNMTNLINMTNIFNLIFITTCCFFKESLSLELTKIVIPTYKFHNDAALLECQYQLNSSKNNKKDYGFRSIHAISNDNNGLDHLSNGGDEETLYSVKWYKDNEEFYRYVPKANPPQQSYRVEGIRVDHQASNDVKVLLKRLTLKSSGLYRCEISAEAPSFSSVEGEGRMEVVYLPRDGPHISGEQKQYQIGDTLNINCTSGKSHPSSSIQWFINDEPVYKTSLVYYPNITHSHGLVTTILGLQVVLDGSHFKNGSMRVKCLTSVSPVVTMNVDGAGGNGSNGGNGNGKTSYIQKRPPLDNREAMLLVRSLAGKLFITFELRKMIALSLLMSLLLFKQCFS